MEEQIKDIYLEYIKFIKPLISEIETREEQTPLNLFNEIRALHDHISRCYKEDVSEEYIADNIAKSKRHVTRLILDCYKVLNVSLHDEVIRFEHETRNVDLTLLDNGEFYPKYKRLKSEAEKFVKEAKTNEGVDLEKSISKFNSSYVKYHELEELIETVQSDVHWARIKFRGKRIFKVVLWILSAIISGVFGNYVWDILK